MSCRVGLLFDFDQDGGIGSLSWGYGVEWHSFCQVILQQSP